MIFDIRALVSLDLAAKINFDLADLEAYKAKFVELTAGTESVTLTGPGPAWLYLALWHEAHGRFGDGNVRFTAPGVDYTPTAAGVATGDGLAIVAGQVIIDISKFEDADPATGRVNLIFGKVNEYQRKAIAMIPAFKPGIELPEFEVVLTGPGPIWLYLGLAAALHSRGGKVIYAAPNAPRVIVIDHK